MKTRITALGALTCSLGLIATATQAQPTEWTVASGGNGHFYEVIPASNISWNAANAAASGMFHNGIQGHLATLTSQAENDFVENLRSQALPDWPQASEAWVGGFQDPCTPEPGCGWKWVNEEGVIPTSQFPGAGYSNWQAIEPNNAGAPFFNEQHLTLGRYPAGQWNDSNEANGAIGGYIVEYDGVADANDCRASSGGCNPSGVQNVILPDSLVLGPNDTLTQKLVESSPDQVKFTDPRVDSNGNCTLTADGFGGPANPRQSFDVFGDGSLILPPHLCGSPGFAVLRSDATFQLRRDVIRSQQFPREIFTPDKNYPCVGFPVEIDVQQRGIFAWQPDNRHTIPEKSVIDVTHGCGSSRGATAGASWFILNLHVDCGIAFGSDTSGVRQCFIDLANDKYAALGQVLQAAKKSLTDIPYGHLQSQFSSSWSAFQAGDYAQALARLAEFISRARNANFSDPNVNHQGNLLMRAEHLQDFVDNKIDF